jgi:hypothetical protein
MINQSPALVARNQRMWVARANGVPVAQLAAEHGLSQSQVYKIIKEVAATIPPEVVDEARKRVNTLLDRLLQQGMEIASMEPPEAYAANGKPLGHRDYSQILAAHDRVLKTVTLQAKLLGLEAPTTTRTLVSAEHSAEQAQAAAQKQAEAVLAGRYGLLTGGLNEVA